MLTKRYYLYIATAFSTKTASNMGKVQYLSEAVTRLKGVTARSVVV